VVHIVWIFRAHPERRGEFLRCYGPQGDWATLFARSPGYRGTTLREDLETPNRFVCIDSWQDLRSFEEFKRTHHDDYNALDRECEALTLEETRIGVFSDQ
jgi:quinol monooxygenase YgiN